MKKLQNSDLKILILPKNNMITYIPKLEYL
jgi:hypothetical protein